MKALMVSHYFDSHQGGIECVAREIYLRVASGKCQVTWAAAHVSEPPRVSANQDVLPLKAWNGLEKRRGLPFPVPSVPSLWRLYKKVRESDVVILHDCLYLSNVAAYRFAKTLRVPVVIVQHLGAIPYRSAPLAMCMKFANRVVTRPMLGRAEQVVFISELTRRYFSDLRFAAPPEIVFNAVDPSIFSPAPSLENKIEARKRLELPQDAPVALFVGRFVEKKGLHLLQAIARQEPGIVWAFAGSGPLDPRHWQLPNVAMFPNRTGADLADLYRACDVLILPSVGEGFPLVIQEALACGLPVVCGADTATADDALAPFVLGIAADMTDTQRAADAFLSGVREMCGAAQDLGMAQRRSDFASSRYSPSSFAGHYDRLLTRISTQSTSRKGTHRTREGQAESLSSAIEPAPSEPWRR